MVIDDPEFKAAAERARGVFGAVGRGKVSASVAMDTALVEMLVLCIRRGEMGPEPFLQHPAHLPEADELRRLMSGTVASDTQLRLDAASWSAINRDVAGRSAVSLRNCVIAARAADDALNDPDHHADLYEWMHEVRKHLHETFGVDHREAPQDRAELELWCITMMNRANPTPEWLRERRGAGSSDVVREPKIAATLAKAFGSREQDDD